MTTPDDREQRREEARRIARAVREASGPAPDDGAARRIADGAWERARMARPARPLRLPAAARRWAVAAAAVIVVGIGAFALRPTEPVFAVEGEPVKVWDEDRWTTTKRVRPGTTVFASDGFRVLRGRGALEGETIRPEAGTTFRIEVTGEGERTLTVQLLGGAAEVRGDALRLCLADVEVAPRRANTAYGVWASVPPSDDVDAPPPRTLDAARAALARVRIRMGDATVLHRSTGETLELEGEEMATLLPVSRGGRTVYRLSRLRRFEPGVGVHIAAGHPVLDVRRSHDGAIAVLGGPDDAVTGVAIEAAELPAALDQMHTAMLAFVSTTDVRIEGAPGGARFEVISSSPGVASLEERAFRTGQTLVEVSVRRDGASVRVLVDDDGRVEVIRDGTAQSYDSLDAARAVDPDAVEVLDRYLDR
jgi:hypothetical protein